MLPAWCPKDGFGGYTEKMSKQAFKPLTHHTRPGPGQALHLVKATSLAPCHFHVSRMPPAGRFPKKISTCQTGQFICYKTGQLYLLTTQSHTGEK